MTSRIVAENVICVTAELVDGVLFGDNRWAITYLSILQRTNEDSGWFLFFVSLRRLTRVSFFFECETSAVNL